MKAAKALMGWGLVLGLESLTPGFANSALASSGAASTPPVYSAQANGPLCPAAANPQQYAGPLLANYRQLFQGQGAWLFRSDVDLRTDFALDADGYQQLERLGKVLKNQGVELVVVYPPSRGLLQTAQLKPAERARFDVQKAQRSYRETLAQLGKANIWTPDLSSLLTTPAATDYFFRGGANWTPDGAKRTAELVAQIVKRIPVYSALPKTQFVTLPGHLENHRGALERAATSICGAGYVGQWFQTYTTLPADAAKVATVTNAAAIKTAPAGAAPARAAPTEIVLIGGGNANPVLNFAGFLAQDLRTPVRNLSVPGTGYANALMSYLLNGDFQKHRPKVLIVEIDRIDTLQQRNFYRQAIPAVTGGCDGRSAVLSNHIQLHAGANEALFNGILPVKPIKGSDYRIDVRFANPKANQLATTLTFMNGRQDIVTLNRQPQVDGKGRFLLELRDDPSWAGMTLLSMSVQQNGAPTGSNGLDVEVCAVPD